ncbi:MAG: hypothetical protein LAT62_08640 [Natronospirillum sp.]|uniref:hypothetical protein n=1 Tax=Natronospirillum sp. TaxID=2812955 RepID=UPI0025E34023|nr:hypothetical protein [Natronospirillum sp.]MCH8551988.1 hypothetical protein [Natronospirillum sp.]
MRLIRLTLMIHLLLHAALWLSAGALLLTEASHDGSIAHFYQVLCGALIIHLGSYHWAMGQWQEDLSEGHSWPSSLSTALITFVLGIVVLLLPPAALFATLAAAALLFWQESWGRIARYIQPWYLRLRWLQMASLVLTQLVLLPV